MMARGPYKSRPDPGSFAELIQGFRMSPRYRGWAPNTRRKNDPILHDFMVLHGRRQVRELTRGLILSMRDQLADTPAAANNWLKCIRVLLDFAVDREFIAHNPARERVERLRPKAPGGFRSWHEHEIAAFYDRWPLGSTAHRVMTLALCTGAARADLVKLGWHSLTLGFAEGHSRIRYQREKTKRSEEPLWIDIPVLPALSELLDTIQRSQMTFLETRDGKPRSELSLTNDMAKWCRLAGLGDPDENGRFLNMHGLRKAVGRRLAEAGCSPYEVASVLGHRSVKSSEVYTKAYDRAKAGDRAMEALGAVKPTNVTKLRRKE